jgi:branched-subunit amino acid transport protein
MVPTQSVAQVVDGVVFFALMFLSGLWTQPVLVGEPLQDILWFSPSGAAARAILASVSDQPLPVTTLVTMACYTVVFAYVAIRDFRWE